MATIAKRALVVARNPLNGIETSSGLERLGYSVDVAGTGLDALRLMGQHCPYELIATELLLDGISGLALVIIARKKNPAIRTIAVNNGGQTLRLFALEIGVDHVLELPVSAEHLYKAAGLILAKTNAEDSSSNEPAYSSVWL